MMPERSYKKLLMTASVYVHIRNFHLPYLQEFWRLGWETHVGCAGIPDDAPYIDRAIELPFKKSMFSLDNFRVAQKLRRLICTEQYDLIITHTTLAAFFTRLAIKGLQKRPELVNVMHGYLFDDSTPFFKRQLFLNAERLTAPETDLLLVMNEWDYETAMKYRLGKNVDKIPGMGVDFSRLDAATPEDGKRLRKDLGIPLGAFVLLFAAEFSKRKSQHVLIEALVRLPQNVKLVLCGTGATLEACKMLAQELGVSDRVLFPGQVADMPAWYRMADAAVTSSRSEGLPFNVVEAMYCGLPVVASAVKGHTDLIEDEETGLLYPYGDAEKCAAQIRRLIDDPALREKICAQRWEKVAACELDAVLPQVMNRYLGSSGEMACQI